MFSALQPRSPLAEFLAAAGEWTRPEKTGVQLSERPFLGHLILRGEGGDPEFLKRVEQFVGIPVPVRPNTFADSDRHAILWLGPDEWLLITSPGSEGHIARGLCLALQGRLSAVTDVTHNQTIIRIRGDRALDVLAKGCSLDLHPSVFGPGCCAQTLLAKAAIIMRWVDRSPTFDLIVRRSFAECVALWLEDAAREYGLVKLT